jgi:non-specific serine/threonine protein kinase/serine/threonine-protein kinase
MGEVWLAEQTTPVRRQVALKVIKAGMDTAQVVARFEAERQALALMDHSAIATVFDGGTTPEGRPYFVMEYVKGEPITTYCDRQRLTVAERLELFTRVCEGVQHAHQKGIIHRDLKPSNVLVTIQDERPVPKIIDFGVAKATAQHLTERTLFTELGVMIGTPEYMSPEQAEMTGVDIDTRTDVYALGVMLYELLTGALPFDRDELRQAGFAEIQRTIREKEPPRPSTRVGPPGPASTEAAKKRHTEPKRLVSDLRGDLDWITMKALEKDRTRRYASASDIAADIQRHLRHEPVQASPPSTTYRVRKFVTRHRVGVLSSALVLLALVGGVAGTTIGLLRAYAAERIASQDAETARQVSDFLIGLFQVSNPNESKGSTITAREILDKGAEKIDRDLGGQPRVQRRLMVTMGQVYHSLGLLTTAARLKERALEVARQMPDQREADVAGMELELAWLYRFQGRLTDAIALCRDGLARREKAYGHTHYETARAVRLLGILLRDAGDFPEAQRLLEDSVTVLEETRGPDDTEVAYSLSHLGWLLRLMGRLPDAQRCYERALTILEARVGTDSIVYAWALNDLAVVDEQLHAYDAARRLHERALAIQVKLLGPEAADVGVSLSNLAVVYWRTRDYEQAAALCERALPMREKALGRDHPDVADTLQILGLVSQDLGDAARARQCYERALGLYEKTYGPRHYLTAGVLVNLGSLLEQAHDLPAASAAYERAAAIYDQVPGIASRDVADALFGAGRLAQARGDQARAAALFDRLLTMTGNVAQTDKPLALVILEAHAALLRQTGRAGEAHDLDARASVLRAQK